MIEPMDESDIPPEVMEKFGPLIRAAMSAEKFMLSMSYDPESRVMSFDPALTLEMKGAFSQLEAACSGATRLLAVELRELYEGQVGRRVDEPDNGEAIGVLLSRLKQAYGTDVENAETKR